MTRIAFTGDMAFSKYFSGSCQDPKLLAAPAEAFLAESEYAVVNVEGAVSSGSLRSDKPLAHANPYESVYWLKRIRRNIWNLANNRAMDCREEGVLQTLVAARENGAQTTGIGKRPCGAVLRYGGILCVP